jgi:RNA polymerase sigma factor (sigma-70 family)
MSPPAEGFASRLLLGPALRAQPDRRLVALVREGYEIAFEEIVRRYGRPLSRYAASIVGGRSEDVTQDAFSKALQAMRRDDAEIELRPWLFRIVRNTALNDLRDRPPSPEALAETLVAGSGNPAEELQRREELADLMRRLRELPEAQRAAIVMRELEGLSHDEIAAALGLTGGGARQAIYRARQALRDGAGMLVPLPLLQAMLGGGGTNMAESAGIGAGVGGATGASVALKATAATVLVAGAVGAGVALKDNSPGDQAKAAPARLSHRGPDTASAATVAISDPSADDAQRGSATGGGPTGASEDRGERRAGLDRNDGDGGQSRGRNEAGGGGPGPSRSDSSGRNGGSSRGSDDSGHSGRDSGGSTTSGNSGSGGDSSGPGEDGSGSGHEESSLESGEESHSGPGSGGESEESVSSGGDSGDSGSSDGGGGDSGSGGGGELSGDLRESSGLTE